MYSVQDYGNMMADRVRIGAYRQALAKTVKPGDVVVDIGTGTGLMAVFACRLGARKVYAIESEEIIELARQVARDNGCADRIEFIRDLSINVELPEKANVIVSDLNGALPFFRRGLEAVMDARRRFLAANGTMVPLRERVWTAAVEMPPYLYDRITVWEDRRWDVDLSAGRRFGIDHLTAAMVEPANLVTEPRCLAKIDYLTLESPSVSSQLCWDATRDAQANAYGLWFDSDLAEGVPLSTAPGQPETIYAILAAPWSRSVTVRKGDRIEADISFKLVLEDYICGWNTRILSESGELREQFHQTNVSSMFITTQELQKRTPEYRPRLIKIGASHCAILALIDGQRTHAQIARLVMQRYPDAFANEGQALETVAAVSEKYSE